jgi:hypothetical protein
LSYPKRFKDYYFNLSLDVFVSAGESSMMVLGVQLAVSCSDAALSILQESIPGASQSQYGRAFKKFRCGLQKEDHISFGTLIPGMLLGKPNHGNLCSIHSSGYTIQISAYFTGFVPALPGTLCLASGVSTSYQMRS